MPKKIQPPMLKGNPAEQLDILKKWLARLCEDINVILDEHEKQIKERDKK